VFHEYTIGCKNYIRGREEGRREKEGGKEVVGICVCMHRGTFRAGREIREKEGGANKRNTQLLEMPKQDVHAF